MKDLEKERFRKLLLCSAVFLKLGSISIGGSKGCPWCVLPTPPPNPSRPKILNFFVNKLNIDTTPGRLVPPSTEDHGSAPDFICLLSKPGTKDTFCV